MVMMLNKHVTKLRPNISTSYHSFRLLMGGVDKSTSSSLFHNSHNNSIKQTNPLNYISFSLILTYGGINSYKSL